MSASVVAATFPNRDGHRLFGILHQPAVPREPGVAILMLSPGVKMRVAPHRLYNKMAARFVALGYPVLRFDFNGLGDSEGEITDAHLADFYGSVQVGRYIADTVAAMDWMQQTHGCSRFIAAGLCGGAITGLLTADRDPRIISLVGLGIPVILDGTQIDFSKYMTDQQLAGTRDRYLRKFRLWEPAVWKSWMRFLSGQSHYSLITRSITKPFAKRLRAAAPAGAAAVSAAPAEPDNTNPHFAPAFRRMLASSRRMFLAFGEADRLQYEFDVKFVQRHRAALDAYPRGYDTHLTPNANHIYSLTPWQTDVFDRCCQWLEAEAATREPRPAAL
ncbi:MAG: CocE/NonD family hydrolase [Vicinamibacteraceae bacterium]